MNKEFLITTLLFSAICGSSNAQVEKQVEVTRAYIPQIETSTKLKIEPDMTDTVYIRPEIDYSITPRIIETTLSTQLYKPATVTYWEFNRPKRVYVKAGIGYPLSSVADVYVSNANPNTNYVVGYLNHNGEYAKVKNDYNNKVSSLNSQNSVGVAAGTYLGSKILEGNVGYDFDVWSRYATANPINEHIGYQTLSFAGRYGDYFIDYSRWNFDFNFGGGYFLNALDDNGLTIDLGTKFGGKLGEAGILIASIDYDYVNGSFGYVNNSLRAGAIYSFGKGSWDFDLGAYFCYDDVLSDEGSNPKQYVIPHLTLRNSTKASIQPFIEVDGELSRNNYAALTKINPYINEGWFLEENTLDYSLRGGILGLLGNGKFSYNLCAAYTITQNALFWSLVETGYQVNATTYGYDNYYSAEGGKLQTLSLNLDLEYRPIGDLTFKVGGFISDYNASEDVDVAIGRSTAKLYFGGEYATKYMRCGITADIQGASNTTLIISSIDSGVTKTDVEVPAALNLKAFAEVSLKNDIALFVELDNITNSKQYEWMGYRKYGIGVMAGVKMQF